jgi:hypothetical protein
MTGKSFTLCAAILGLAVAGIAFAQTLPAPAPVTATPAAKPAVAVPPKPAMAKPAMAKLPIASAATAAKTQWKDLSPPQQLALDPLKTEWDHMETVRRQKWLDIANRYSSMKPDEQLRVQERMRAWLKLTPEERRVARENYTLSKKIDKGQKSAQWEQYQQLPEEEKRKLAADAATKKLTNLPPKTQPKAVAPIKPGKTVPCPAGMLANTNPAGPACIPAPPAAPAAVPPATTPPAAAPAVPVPNAK